jgi:chaperonin GroES
MKIKPLHDRVVVRVEDSETTTESGIVIPDNAKEKPTTGSVVAVGPGHWNGSTFVATSVTEGMKVLFGQYAGQKVKVEGEELTILREDDILAIIN